MTKDVMPDSNLFEFSVKLNFNNFINNLGFTKSLIIKLLSVSWLFILITFFEFIKSKNIRNLSISRINYSKGGKYADLIYYILSLFEFKLSYLTYFATLGISRFSGSFRSFLNKVYENLVPIDFFSNSFTIFLLQYGQMQQAIVTYPQYGIVCMTLTKRRNEVGQCATRE